MSEAQEMFLVGLLNVGKVLACLAAIASVISLSAMSLMIGSEGDLIGGLAAFGAALLIIYIALYFV